MAKRVINGTGGGDPRNIVDQDKADVLIPENPGYVSEAAFRHAESPQAEAPELSPNQTIPGRLEERHEPSLQPEHLRFSEETDHQST